MTQKQLLAGEALPMLVQEISDVLQLSEEDYERLLEFVLALFDEEQIVDLTETTLMQQLTFLIDELFHGEREIITNKLIQLLQANFEQIKTDDQLMHQLPNDQKIGPFPPLNFVHSQVVENELPNDQQHLLQQFVTLMQSINSEEDLLRQTPAILKLLEQWSQLGQHLQQQFPEQVAHGNDRALQLWEDLINRYMKRMRLGSQTPYMRESKVTTDDVAKWIKHLEPALLNQQQNQHDSAMPTHPILNAKPMSPIEQYVIYMQHADDDQVTSDQLLRQFRQIIQASQFSPLQSMQNQLAITLKPDNLGEMLVRFVEVNGEMAVKIFVSSQATKSLLETNIHQLKHMFAPHQISIEKTIDHEQLLAKDDSFMKDDEAHDEQKDQQDEQKEQASDNEHADFQKLLNEFV